MSQKVAKVDDQGFDFQGNCSGRCFHSKILQKINMQIRQSSGSPVEGLRILNPKVLGSSPGVLSSLKAIILSGTIWQRETSASHFNNLRVERNNTLK